MLEDFRVGDELDEIERKLKPLRERYLVVWKSILHARHGVRPLDRETYIQRKIEHGNLQYAIGELENEQRDNEGWYHGIQTAEWKWALEPPAKVTLKTLWQLWRNVLATRQVVAYLPALYRPQWKWDDFALAEHAARHLASDKVPSRQRIDAVVARDRAEATYNCALRVFEGRERWDWDKHVNDGRKMSAPKRPLNGGSSNKRARVRSTYIGA